MSAHIITMGGGGFHMSADHMPTALDRYILEASSASNPLVCFAPTASADSAQYINRFLVAYGALGVRTMVLTVWEGEDYSVKRLPEADVVIVGGGSTVNLMALWQAHGIDRVLRERATSDVVYAGVSAGANCWFEACSTDSFGGLAPWRGGLGLLPGSFCPHYDGEAERAPAFANWVADGSLPAGWAADDGAAIHFRDSEVVAYLSERPGAKAYRVRPSNNPGGSGVLCAPMEMTAI